MDEWDNLILPREQPPKGVKVNLANGVPADIFSEVLKEKPLLPELKKKIEEVAVEVSQKSLSPYVSILPALWNASLASKFIVSALALTIMFGAYSGYGYLSRFGDTKESNMGQLAAPAVVVINVASTTATTTGDFWRVYDEASTTEN